MDRPATEELRLDVVQMTIVDSDKEGVLVGEVLVERADRDAGSCRHLIGGGGVPPLPQNVRSLIENPLDGTSRAGLDRATSSPG